MKLTKEQLKRIIKEELGKAVKEFYDRGPNISNEGEIISSKAWLKAFEEKGIKAPRDYTYMSNFKINPDSQYRGAWGTQYDAMADSGGPFAEELEQRAIEIHKQMKRDAERGPQLSSDEKEEKRIKDIRSWSDDELYQKVMSLLKRHKAQPDVMTKDLVDRTIDNWQKIRKG